MFKVPPSDKSNSNDHASNNNKTDHRFELLSKIAKANNCTLSSLNVPQNMLNGCNTCSVGYLPFIEASNISSAISFYEQVMRETPTKSDQDHQPAVLSIKGKSDTKLPSLGIIGGMGPAATLLLLKIISDYQHPKIVVAMVPFIADRTQALLTNDPDLSRNIFSVLNGSEALLIKMGCEHTAIPCNTVHAFVDNMSEKFVHMIKATAQKLYSLKVKQVVSFATEGTNSVGIYTKHVQQVTNGKVHVITPEKQQQTQMMSIIYDEVKAKGVTDTAIEKFCDLVKHYLTALLKTGMESKLHIGLFCTEFPLVAFETRTVNQLKNIKFKMPDGKEISAFDLVEFHDPMRILAEVLLKN